MATDSTGTQGKQKTTTSGITDPDTMDKKKIAMVMKLDKTGIPVFDGKNYQEWKIQIEDFLTGNDITRIINPLDRYSNDLDWDLLDRRVMGIIRSTLSYDVRNSISSKEDELNTTKLLLAYIEKTYVPSTAMAKYNHILKLTSLKYTVSSGQSISEFMALAESYISTLTKSKLEMTDVYALAIFQAIPGEYKIIKEMILSEVGLPDRPTILQ